MKRFFIRSPDICAVIEVGLYLYSCRIFNRQGSKFTLLREVEIGRVVSLRIRSFGRNRARNLNVNVFRAYSYEEEPIHLQFPFRNGTYLVNDDIPLNGKITDTGNGVAILVDDVYVILWHLEKGSIVVREGDVVKAGKHAQAGLMIFQYVQSLSHDPAIPSERPMLDRNEFLIRGDNPDGSR